MAAYISGYNNTMDVVGFGFNTQSAMFYQSQHAQYDVHNGVICDSCGANPLRGIRWRCQTCPDHDICNECKSRGSGAGHTFTIMSVTATNNLNAAAQGLPQVVEDGVHWVACKGCSAYPIRGTLHSCTVCLGFDMCDGCNQQRINTQNHQHRFDFFYCPRACNPPPNTIPAHTAQTYNQNPNHYQGGSAEQQVAQMQAEQAEIVHEMLVEQEERQSQYNNSVGAQQYGYRKRDKVQSLMDQLRHRY